MILANESFLLVERGKIMRVLGVIAEWNPFHDGHRYLLETVKQLSPDTPIVAVMSGNFVQRGDPALISKWERAKSALNYGADLVFELPLWYATQPADYFARGGVNALASLGVDGLFFGVESFPFNDYVTMANWEGKHPEIIQRKMRQFLLNNPNLSATERYFKALKQAQNEAPCLASLNLDFQMKSNNLLGYIYCREIATWNLPIEPLPIARLGAQHRETANSKEVEFLSGSQIRASILGGKQDHVGKMPLELIQAVDDLPCAGTWQIFYPLLRYRLLTASLEELSLIYQVDEGIEHLLKQAAKKASTMEEWLDICRSRNWSEGRLKRTALMILLNIKNNRIKELMDYQHPQPLLLLGMTAKGQKYLRQLKKAETEDSWQIISRVNQECERKWPEWLIADRIYRHIVYQDEHDENFSHQPIIIK